MEAEAGGEGDAGKMAVANVVRNRADSNYSGYGGNIQKQVLAPAQFSAFLPHNKVNATGKRTMALPLDGETMRHNLELADQVLARMTPDNTHGANQYYAPQGMPGHKAPRWWKDSQQTATVGHQRFQYNPDNPMSVDNGRQQMGDQQMLASLGGGKTQDAGTSPMATMMAQAVAPKPTQVAGNPPLPPEAASNQRYAAMNSVAPRPDNNTSFRDMARHTAYAPNRMEAMGDVKPMSSAEYLVANSGDTGVSARDPGVSAPAPPPSSPMADTPVLHEPIQAGSPGGEGMAMNAMTPEMQQQPSGLSDIMAMAVAPPAGGMGMDPGFNMGGGGGFGGLDFGGGFNLGGLFG